MGISICTERFIYFINCFQHVKKCVALRGLMKVTYVFKFTEHMGLNVLLQRHISYIWMVCE